MEAGVDGEFGLAHMIGLSVPPGCVVVPRVIIRLLTDGPIALIRSIENGAHQMCIDLGRGGPVVSAHVVPMAPATWLPRGFHSRQVHETWNDN